MKTVIKVFKLLIIISLLLLLTFCVFSGNLLSNNFKVPLDSFQINNLNDEEPTTLKENYKNSNLKYILLYTNSRAVPFVYMGEGQKGFIDQGCPYTNCYSTGDKNYLGDIRKFDLVAFNGPQAIHLSKYNFPLKRSPHQKYVFATIESPHYYPLCDDRYDGFFNWTWTYKLDSDAKWGYMVVRDTDSQIIGPKTEMQWLKHEDMEPVTEEFKERLKSKTMAAAWFVSNCVSRSEREVFVTKLQEELKFYNLTVDIYGKCGPLKCETGAREQECEDLVKNKYYFYLSFENSISEDYVTEKLVRPLQNDAVPIVYGGANYTRFMPDNIYLDARKLGVKALAKKMNDLINDPVAYAEMFRWKNHYSYHRRMESLETNDYCIFCEILNNEELMKTKTVYKDFKKWWMGDTCPT